MPKPRISSFLRGDPFANTSRGSMKATLALLVSLMLGLLLWQLHQEARQHEAHQQQSHLAQAQQLSQQLALGMRLLRDQAQVLLQPHSETTATLSQLRPQLAHLKHLSWQAGTHETLYQLPTLGDDIQLFLPSANGHWQLSFAPELINHWLSSHPQPWYLTNSQGQIIAQQGELKSSTTIELEHAQPSAPIAQSAWQAWVPFEQESLRRELLMRQANKLLIFILCGTLSALALFSLFREQHRLRTYHALSRRSMEDALGALGAIDERVLVTLPDGQISYLNPRAEQMFGIDLSLANDMHVLHLLPALSPWLSNSLYESAEPIEILLDGQKHLFQVTCHTLHTDDNEPCHAWVLRDVTEEQHALRILQDTRRRYQDIFEGSGVALCVLDLFELKQQLEQLSTNDQEALRQSAPNTLSDYPQLPPLLRISEANVMAMELFAVPSSCQIRQQLNLLRLPNQPNHDQALPYAIVQALLNDERSLTLECSLQIDGELRHLWLNLQLPEVTEDLREVTLSLHDLTSRKHAELVLAERERFWAEVLSAVPDTLYVHDLNLDQVMFSNNRLAPDLGYSKPDLKRLGKKFWEKITHPDDLEHYNRLLRLRPRIADGQQLHSRLRWLHRDGSWRWFDLREQILRRNAQGNPTLLIGVAKDVTSEIIAQNNLRDSERRYRLLAESISDVIISSDRNLQFNYISPSAQHLFGHRPEWLLEHGVLSNVSSPEQVSDLQTLLSELRAMRDDPEQLTHLQDSLRRRTFVFDYLRDDGSSIIVEMRLTLMWDEQQQFEGVLSISRDITLQRRSERDLRMAATVFEHSTAAIVVTDPIGYIASVNETFQRITGYQRSDVLDRLPSMLTADRQQSAQLNYIRDQLSLHDSWEGELWLKRSDGETYPAWAGVTAVLDNDGDLVSYVCFFNDISERKASEQRIHRLAYYDALTLLPNRTLFQDRLHTALQHAQRNDAWVVLMFLDLDRFKPINDSLGHAAGDRMLKEVAQRLATCVDQEDTVARMGGDEFTLLLTPCNTRGGALYRAIHVAEQILASLAQPFVLEGREFFVTASIGMALSPQDGNELSQLMKNADTAMYHAKERGKNNFQFYQSDMNATALQRLELESDLRHALDAGQFQLFYQAQFSGDGQHLIGAEALLRWHHPRRGMVSPAEFIPVLEEIGLIVQVGDWVINEACQQMRQWRSSGLKLPKISVNLSARQFADGQLSVRIANILEAHHTPAHSLELELTESILMRDLSETMNTLDSLKRLGLNIAIDDFGTGYSSLNYLKQFPIDVLKIDHGFVDGLPSGKQDAQIARAIIAMAHSLNLTVIAEGVETEAQLQFLREHRCDQVQGFLLGRPMAAQHFAQHFSPQVESQPA